MKRPVSAAGLLIMIAAVVVGFIPTLPSILLLFVTTLFGGYQIKKHAPESYDGFIKAFGLLTIIFNMVAVGMIMLTPLEYVDKVSAAFLNMMVVFIIITLFKNNRNDRNNSEPGGQD